MYDGWRVPVDESSIGMAEPQPANREAGYLPVCGYGASSKMDRTLAVDLIPP